MYKWGDGCIARARNELAHEFLASSADWLVFWSDDIEVVSPDNALLRLVGNPDRPFTGGLYAKSMVCDDPRTSEVASPVETDGDWLKMAFLSSGLWCVHRQVFKTLAITDGDGYVVQRGGERHRRYFYESVTDDGRFLTEDYSFCRDYRDAGGTIWANTAIQVHHWGMAPFGLARGGDARNAQ